MPEVPAAVQHLRNPRAIRQRCANILRAGRADELTHFRVVDEAMESLAERVVQVTRANYPTLDIPYHSRWNHFRVGGVDRAKRLDQISDLDARARAQLDLAVVSVLLDAGAGPDWCYQEGDSVFTRSEGLAVASVHMFCNGAFSASQDDPLRVDASALQTLSVDDITRGFQVTERNPLVGLEGRTALLQSLGSALEASPNLFRGARPGGLFDQLDGESVRADALLQAVLRGLGSIWPSRHAIAGHNLGDVWPHRAAGGEGETAGWVPFHKLSQWLTYSLLEPFEWRGRTVGWH